MLVALAVAVAAVPVGIPVGVSVEVGVKVIVATAVKLGAAVAVSMAVGVAGRSVAVAVGVCVEAVPVGTPVAVGVSVAAVPVGMPVAVAVAVAVAAIPATAGDAAYEQARVPATNHPILDACAIATSQNQPPSRYIAEPACPRPPILLTRVSQRPVAPQIADNPSPGPRSHHNRCPAPGVAGPCGRGGGVGIRDLAQGTDGALEEDRWRSMGLRTSS